MQDKRITATLCEFASQVRIEDLPSAVAERAALLVTDSSGIAIRARKEAESTPALLAAVARMGMDNGTASVFADEKGYAFPAAALINGSLIHSLDFDDTHIDATVHPPAPVLSGVPGERGGGRGDRGYG